MANAPQYIIDYMTGATCNTAHDKITNEIHPSWFEDEYKNLLCYEPCDDLIKSPSHYTAGGIETIDFIRAKLTTEEFKGYCKGNIIKYISRAGKKKSSTMKEDLQKAETYLKWLEEIA